MLCRVAAVQSLPVYHHSADYVFKFFGIIEPILVILKVEYRLSRRLRGVGGGGGVGERMQHRKLQCCI